MHRRPLIYAPSGIIPVHISIGITGSSPMCDGPRTTRFCNRLSFNKIRISRVRRSPLFEGDHEQGYFALHCVSVDYEKLMFAVRLPVQRVCVVLQILHSACGSVQDDRRTATSMMAGEQLRLW